MSLRDLDDKYVPRLAEGLDRALSRLPRKPPPPPGSMAPLPRSRVARPPARPRPAPPAPTTGPAPLVVRLRGLDDRYASRGPLALFREVPQLAAVVVAALLLAGSIAWKVRQDPQTRAGDGSFLEQVDPDGPSDGTVGPEVNDEVNAYIERTRDRLTRLAVGTPDGVVAAVVMFDEYQTPEEVAQLLGPIQVRQIFYRPPVRTGVVGEAGVENLVPDTRKVFRDVARLKAEELKELRKVTATIENDPTQKADQEKDIRALTREVRMLRGRCACVFAVVVVRAQLRLLLDALNVSGIRAIDVSEIGADAGVLDFNALLPEEKVTFTGGNAHQ